MEPAGAVSYNTVVETLVDDTGMSEHDDSIEKRGFKLRSRLTYKR